MPPEPPHRLDVELRHDGVRCRTQRAVQQSVVAVFGPLVALAVAGAVVAGGAVSLWWLVPLLLLPPPLALLMFPERWTVDVTERWIDIERSAPMRSERWRIELGDLERWYVAEPREDYGGHFLIVKGGGETVKVAEGRPFEELAWMKAAIDEAMERWRRREAVEGKEWGFQKKAPAKIRALVERE